MKSRRLIATTATTLGVMVIWAFASYRQEDQTVQLSRRWVGEQWDIARRCVIGTPVGRGENREAKADRMAALALEALVAASESADEPDLDHLWPARCAPLFRQLHVAPEVTGGDVSGPVGELEVLIGRVIELDDVERTVANARELAESIHALDHGMPPGAEYDPSHFVGPTLDPTPIEASFNHPARPAPRPFLEASSGGQPLYDELDGARLTGGDDGFRRETPDGQTELAAEGLTFPRFMDDEVAWLVEGEAAIRIGERRVGGGGGRGGGGRGGGGRGGGGRTVTLPFESPPSAFAPCAFGSDGEEAFLVQVGEDVHYVRGGRSSRVRPTPPRSNVVWACDGETALLAWPAEADGRSGGTRWTGSRCDRSGCAVLPPLHAGGDLDVAVGHARTIVVARGRRTALRLWRELTPEGWSEPMAVPFGVPEASERGLMITAGERSWTLIRETAVGESTSGERPVR